MAVILRYFAQFGRGQTTSNWLKLDSYCLQGCNEMYANSTFRQHNNMTYGNHQRLLLNAALDTRQRKFDFRKLRDQQLSSCYFNKSSLRELPRCDTVFSKKYRRNLVFEKKVFLYSCLHRHTTAHPPSKNPGYAHAMWHDFHDFFSFVAVLVIAHRAGCDSHTTIASLREHSCVHCRVQTCAACYARTQLTRGAQYNRTVVASCEEPQISSRPTVIYDVQGHSGICI